MLSKEIIEKVKQETDICNAFCCYENCEQCVIKYKVSELRTETNCGLIECKEAIDIFDGNIKQTSEYLKMKSHAVCRRKADGEIWNRQDYIDWVRMNVK